MTRHGWALTALRAVNGGAERAPIIRSGCFLPFQEGQRSVQEVAAEGGNCKVDCATPHASRGWLWLVGTGCGRLGLVGTGWGWLGPAGAGWDRLGLAGANWV